MRAPGIGASGRQTRSTATPPHRPHRPGRPGSPEQPPLAGPSPGSRLHGARRDLHAGNTFWPPRLPVVRAGVDVDAVAGPALTPSSAEQGQECGSGGHTPAPLSPGWSGSCVKLCATLPRLGHRRYVAGPGPPYCPLNTTPFRFAERGRGEPGEVPGRRSQPEAGGGHQGALAACPRPRVRKPGCRGHLRGWKNLLEKVELGVGGAPSLQVNAVPAAGLGPPLHPHAPAGLGAHRGPVSAPERAGGRPSLGSPLRW